MAEGKAPALLDAAHEGFDAALEKLLASEDVRDAEAEQVAAEIIGEVRARGDAALLEYTAQLDGRRCASAAELEIPPARMQEALSALPAVQRSALERAAERIRAFHDEQLRHLCGTSLQEPGHTRPPQTGAAASWSYTDAEGLTLGQQLFPLERVGLYVPGGRAAYPSSVLMTALPARAAGVEEIVMATPASPEGEPAAIVLAAAALAGVHRVFACGGAQAIAALTFGTKTVPATDKIVGPGNRFVAAAKRLVHGRVGTDAPAGPSEVVIIADGSTEPEWTAMDLLAQAEHDEAARAILLSPDRTFLQQVQVHMAKQLAQLPRREIIENSLACNGALIHTADLRQAASISERIAPEHLGLAVANPEEMLLLVRRAGAIFLGPWASEVLGDYCAGPSHVLPTGGAARFSSPLGVRDFMRACSLIECSEGGAAALADTAAALARAEGLEAHAQAAECRKKQQP